MKTSGSDNFFTILDRMMSQLGLHKDLAQHPQAGAGRPVDRLVYMDLNGNEICLRFSVVNNPKGPVLVIKGTYNQEQPKTWQSFESFMEEIGTTVREWRVGPRPVSDATGKAPVPPVVVSAPKKSLDVRSVINDIRAGMDDAGLMAKYALSRRRLLSIFSKLIWDGKLTSEELAERKSLAKTVYMPVFQCRLCKELHFEKVQECPKCGGPVRLLNRRDEDYEGK